MGCLKSKFFGKSHEEEEEEPQTTGKKEYSWDKRPKVDPKDFRFEGLQNQSIGKLPGQINGQQFTINNCQDCNIYLFDYLASINIDDCKHCNIFVGPVKGSIFVRDSSNCHVAAVCQQFRMRDCHDVSSLVACSTQPIIESSDGIRFGPFPFSYSSLAQQLEAAGLSPFNCNWETIHDFSPDSVAKNYSLILNNAELDNFLPAPPEEFSSQSFSDKSSQPVVPLTSGVKALDGLQPQPERCLLVIFAVERPAQSSAASPNVQKELVRAGERAHQYMLRLLEQQTDLKLLRCREHKLTAEDTQRLLEGSKAFINASKLGPSVALELAGRECVTRCRATAAELGLLHEGKGDSHCYISSSPAVALSVSKLLFELFQMQMGA